MKATQDHRKRASVAADQIGFFIRDSPHNFTSSYALNFPVLLVLIHPTIPIHRLFALRALAPLIIDAMLGGA